MVSGGRGVSRSEVEELLKESERHTAALFDEVFGRLDRIDGRMDGFEGRIDRLEAEVSRRFDSLEGRIDRLERHVVLINKRFDRLELALAAAIPGLSEILGSPLPQE